MKAGTIPQELEKTIGEQKIEKGLNLCRELLKWGKVHNLTGHRDLDSAWEDLILDAWVLAGLVKGPKVLDIGSGAGFPGLPLALARDDIEVTMLEPRAKRISFQKHVVRILGLEQRVYPVMGSAGIEGLGGEKFDTVVLRAVASVEKSLDLAEAYRVDGGIIILPRGMKDREIAHRLGLETREYRIMPESSSRLAILA